MRLLKGNTTQHFEPSQRTPSEQVQVCCATARERLETGDYDLGCAALQPWWTIGEWPKHSGLEDRAAAELFFTAGVLSSWVSTTRQINGGQKPAEGLLNAAITLFERLEEGTRAAEVRIELACCYYRQNLFDLARETVRSSLQTLSEDQRELKSIALIRLAVIEVRAGRLHDALGRLNEAAPLVKTCGAHTKARFHAEFATTLKNLGIADSRTAYLDRALDHYGEALTYFEKIGNRRYTAVVENNHGYLLSSLKRFDEAQLHLDRARSLFDELGDQARRAQVDETLAQLYLASGRFETAKQFIELAVDTMDANEEGAPLSEALTTQGLILCRLERRHEAKPTLERARRVAERCGDSEGAGRALLILMEELCEWLGEDERREIGARANQLLATSQQKLTRERLRACLARIAAARAEFEQQREEAVHTEKMAALGELSFGVAHNVNNTLTGILGRAQLLLRTRDAEKITSGIELIIKSAEDGAHIIRRIQDFARRQPSRKFELVSVAELMKDVCEMSRPRCDVAGSEIRMALVADCQASVMGDPVELREVLVNMIFNAIDATPAGGEIRLSAQETDGRVVLSIADTGTGMTAEVKSRLFDPFFTTKGKAGTGMGLAVSFGIIRRHNGSVEVESEQGKGTTFRVSLPVADAVSSALDPSSTREEVSTVGEQLRVLVVDDERAVREVLREALEAEGCEVSVADSGEMALQLYDAAKGKLDIVFTDIGMPEMSGWELAREIRKRSETIPLAIVSGWADAISCDDRQAIGADWVVAKPFDIATISEIANEVMKSRKNQSSGKQGSESADLRTLFGLS